MNKFNIAKIKQQLKARKSIISEDKRRKKCKKNTENIKIRIK